MRQPTKTVQPIRSVYLTAVEDQGVRELARRNGVKVNLVMRIAVRRLLGFQTPALEGEGELSSQPE